MGFLFLYQSINCQRIAFLNVLPGVNPGAFRAESVILSPVLGLRPTRCARLLTLNVPKPVRTTFSPRLSESRIVFNVVWTESLAALLVKFDFLATISMRSFLVNSVHLPSKSMIRFKVQGKRRLVK